MIHKVRELADPPERILYPINEARRLLGGVCRATLYKLIDDGELRTVRLGRRRLVPADEINRLAQEAA